MTGDDSEAALGSRVEQAVDDLLLAVDEVTAGDTASLASRVSDRISDAAMPVVEAYVAAHPGQRRGAKASADSFTTATRDSVAVHALLAAWLLGWASERTGLPVARVLELAVPLLKDGV